MRLTGTPSFIIGKTTDDVIKGQVIVGAQPMNVFDAAINKPLAQKPVERKTQEARAKLHGRTILIAQTCRL